MTAIAARTMSATIEIRLSSVASSAGTNVSTRPATKVTTATSATNGTDANTAASIGTAAIMAMNTACWPVTMPSGEDDDEDHEREDHPAGDF